ncbi:MAG: CocE/NonD family hydrolase C-terminal non-catalytic domain-containing protein, partial [Spirochaetota bacterium]
GVEVVSNVNLLNRVESIAYESDAFTSVKKIRGGSEAKISISLSQAKGQIVLYLYDVSSSGKAVYITHGVHTFWDAVPGETAELTVPIIATAYDIPAGHHLALVIDSSDPLYAKPSLIPFIAKISYSKTSSKQNTLCVPFEN